MIRGIISFKCTHCGKLFFAPDIEYAASTLSVPQKCPKCGSIRTRPASLFGKLQNKVYQQIWKQIER